MTQETTTLRRHRTDMLCARGSAERTLYS